MRKQRAAPHTAQRKGRHVETHHEVPAPYVTDTQTKQLNRNTHTATRLGKSESH